MAILSLDQVSLAYGGQPLLDAVTLHIERQACWGDILTCNIWASSRVCPAKDLSSSDLDWKQRMAMAVAAQSPWPIDSATAGNAPRHNPSGSACAHRQNPNRSPGSLSKGLPCE